MATYADPKNKRFPRVFSLLRLVLFPFFAVTYAVLYIVCALVAMLTYFIRYYKLEQWFDRKPRKMASGG